VPVEAVSCPAENRDITVEVGDRPKIDVIPVVLAGSTSVTVFLFASIFVVAVTVVRLRSCLQPNSKGRLEGEPVNMTTRGIEGHKDGHMLLIPIESIGGRLGGGRCFLVPMNGGVSNRVESYLRKNERPVLLRHQPARNVPETMGSVWSALPISIQEI